MAGVVVQEHASICGKGLGESGARPFSMSSSVIALRELRLETGLRSSGVFRPWFDQGRPMVAQHLSIVSTKVFDNAYFVPKKPSSFAISVWAATMGQLPGRSKNH